MKEQARQYQATAFLKKGSITRQFKSKKKGEDWAKEQKDLVSYVVAVVK